MSTKITSHYPPDKKGKHPKALFVLFFTEMWERFAYYLLAGVLLIYLTDDKTGGKALSENTGASIVGSFIALVFLTPFIGGLLADRYLGYIKSIFLGGLLMSAGYLGLSLPGDTAMFVSLGLVIIGNGFFKPNISTLVGNIYNREDLKHLKDNAYNIFYMGINIGAFACNFIAAWLRNAYGWGYAFAAAGIGLLIGLTILALSLKNKEIKSADVKKPVQPEDMPLAKIFMSVFLPALFAAIIGWFLPSQLFGNPLMGSKANDAFIFACVPVIAFYCSLWIRAKGQDKKGIGALLFIFAISVAFWTIYNQNATGLTLWAEKHTDRSTSGDSTKLISKIFPLQRVTDTLRLEKKLDSNMVIVTDEKGEPVKEMGPDPYFVNVPKQEWPGGKVVFLTNTELYQSINPFFIVTLTLFFVPLFSYLKKKGKEPTTMSKFGMALFLSGLSAFVMILAIQSVPSIYTHKTAASWLWYTYFLSTMAEVFLSPMGLSLVSKLSPPRLTSLMMGGWFLSTSIGGKVAGVMTSFWDDFTDKKIFFLILVIAAFIGGILVYARIRLLNQIVREKTGAD